MSEFEVFKNETLANLGNVTEEDAKKITLKDFYEQKLYPQSMDEDENIKFIDPEGEPRTIKTDELFYVEALLGEVNWRNFAEKNQERIDKLKKREVNIEKEQVKQE